MASPGPALSHLTMPSCTAPHCSSASTPPSPAPSIPLCTSPPPAPPLLPLLAPATHSVFPHGSILLLCRHHPHPPAATCPGPLCHLHGLVDPSLPSSSPPKSPLSRGPSPASPIQAPVVPRIPPPTRGPLRACCLSSCCLFISLHIPVPMWAFFWEELNLSARQLPGEQEGARAQPGDRSERGGQGVVGARGLGKQGDVRWVEGRGLGQGGMVMGGPRVEAEDWSDGGGGM